MNSIDSISDPVRMLALCKAHLTNQVERLESLMARELIREGDYLKWMNQFKLAYDATTACRHSYSDPTFAHIVTNGRLADEPPNNEIPDAD